MHTPPDPALPMPHPRVQLELLPTEFASWRSWCAAHQYRDLPAVPFPGSVSLTVLLVLFGPRQRCGRLPRPAIATPSLRSSLTALAPRRFPPQLPAVLPPTA